MVEKKEHWAENWQEFLQDWEVYLHSPQAFQEKDLSKISRTAELLMAAGRSVDGYKPEVSDNITNPTRHIPAKPSQAFDTALEAIENAAKMMLKSRLEVMELQAEIDRAEQVIDRKLDNNQALLDRLVANG